MPIPLSRESEQVEPSVLPEVTIKRERRPGPSRFEDGERDGVTEAPVLVRVSGEDLACSSSCWRARSTGSPANSAVAEAAEDSTPYPRRTA